MRILYALLLLVGIVLWSSCREDFDTTLSTGNLRFSQDTIFLDTVFTNIGSSTRNFTVFNDSDEAIRIPTVSLGEGEASDYRLNVDGIAGRVFQDVEILANDSIFVFVETTLDIDDFGADNGQFLSTDIIEFDTGANSQTVDLVTLVQDAIFLFPGRDDATGIVETLTINGAETSLEGRFLMEDELTFTADLPYVIFGYMAVGDPINDTPTTLNIEPGARIHFHDNSGIIVASNGSLQVNGELSSDPELLENEVIFEGDRLEPGFADTPGQWGTILLTSSSVNNSINYATIKNATIGILNESRTETGAPNLTITNSQLYNHAVAGMIHRFSRVEGSNTIVNNCGQFSMLIQVGGDYSFNHCTFANFWTQSFRNTPAVQLDNSLFDAASGTLFLGNLTAANFNNCIITGNQNEEFFLVNEDGADFNFNISNSNIRFDNNFGAFDEEPLFDFENAAFYQNITLGGELDFLDPSSNLLQIGAASQAIGIGDPTVAQQFPFDITGTSRTAAPDLGAYQNIVFPED